MLALLLVLVVTQSTKDGVSEMEDIFSKAEALRTGKEPIARRKGKGSAGCIVRREGKEIVDTIKRVHLSYPSVKRKEKIDRSALDASSVEGFSSPVIRRKELGKYVYSEREQLLKVLVGGYSVELSSVADLSFNDLLIKFDDVKVGEAKKLDSLRKSKKDYEERLGAFYNSFKLVSNVVSIINSEHTKLEPIERDEEEEVGSALTLSPEERVASDERWALRKTVLKERYAAARLEDLACKDLTAAEVADVLAGKVIKMVDPAVVKLQKKKEERLQFFLSKGLNHLEASEKVKHWEANQ